MDSPAPSSCGGRTGNIGSTVGSSSDDPFSVAAMMNFDGYSELCSPSVSDQSFTLLNGPTIQQMCASWASTGSPHASGVNEVILSEPGEVVARQRTDLVSGLSAYRAAMERVAKSLGQCVLDDGPQPEGNVIPRPISTNSLANRMLMALSLFRESLNSRILAQVWMPIKQGDHEVLSTSEQPFLLDQALGGYREVSRHFVFSAKEEPGMQPGLPGRVFMSGMPEWTSSVVYYNKPEYLRMEYALCHDVRGSLAMPVFDPSKGSCCAVLELVTKREESDFDTEMDSVCNALQAVNLKTAKPHGSQQCCTESQKSAFCEVLDVLRASCHAHMLPVALTWVPKCNSVADSNVVGQDVGGNLQSGKAILRIHESACYAHDVKMQGFVHACAKHHLEKGQGTAGKALESNLPFFSPDIREYDIQDYPLVHHARKFGLHAAVAIRLRSTYTGNDDYILEFFLPVNCRGSGEQQMLLNTLSTTMQRICKTYHWSLRTVSDAEVDKLHACTGTIDKKANENFAQAGCPVSSTHGPHGDNQPIAGIAFGDLSLGSDEREAVVEPKQVCSSSMRNVGKKRSTSEKNISLDVLRNYFSGSLKDAAKRLDVCPTTLKRICRQHGISRWPSREIKKVKRSLRGIQNVMNSGHGVDGSFQYDPATRSLVAVVSMPEQISPTDGAVPTPSVHRSSDEKSIPKREPENSLPDRWPRKNLCQLQHSDAQKREGAEFCSPMNICSELHNYASHDASLSQHSNSEGTQQGPLYSIGAASTLNLREADCPGPSGTVRPRVTSIEGRTVGRNTPSVEETDANMVDGYEAQEVAYPSTSDPMDSSSGSAPSHPTFKISKCTLVEKSSSTFTVKATYNGDTVRFKLLPSMGLYHLLEEIAKRFNLLTGGFQLKYKDDEDEWVILANDSDLHECIDVLDSIGSRNVKLQVRDLPSVISSSGSSSSCLQVEAHGS